jgi:hypothetical protein
MNFQDLYGESESHSFDQSTYCFGEWAQLSSYKVIFSEENSAYAFPCSLKKIGTNQDYDQTKSSIYKAE